MRFRVKWNQFTITSPFFSSINVFNSGQPRYTNVLSINEINNYSFAHRIHIDWLSHQTLAFHTLTFKTANIRAVSTTLAMEFMCVFFIMMIFMTTMDTPAKLLKIQIYHDDVHSNVIIRFYFYFFQERNFHRLLLSSSLVMQDECSTWYKIRMK